MFYDLDYLKNLNNAICLLLNKLHSALSKLLIFESFDKVVNCKKKISLKCMSYILAFICVYFVKVCLSVNYS